MTNFTVTTWLLLLAAWVLSGDRFLDWAYQMPDLGPLDDRLLDLLTWLDDRRAALGLGDVFGRLRSWLHATTGLG
ncbi:hypothetical protein [Pseudooceanicola nanhaiensis]|uniref:hypothetical protein n=1 Tax=Pseudooceanicola nanhaiensis TaxID=375761 RepID=UPI001CD4F41F|nr:hypothetical protein [Pseudooceanicola nanhaiensis]MCA0921170.1 hypothetical protein [Pseudooceanicola nanhaiensis]